MKSSLLSSLLAGSLVVAGAAFAADAADIVSHRGAATPLEVLDVKSAADGSVTGRLHNTSTAVIKDVKLLVTYTWYWNDERHPGDDNPGRSAYVAISGELPPGGSAPFNYTPNPLLPKRTDGTFKTTVGVQEFAQVGE
jgi:hypothetical protein